MEGVMPNEYKIPRTYSIYMSTHEKFRMACSNNKIGMSEVLNQLMLSYAEGGKVDNAVDNDSDIFGDDDE